MKTTDALFQSIYPNDGMLVVGLVAQVGTNLDDLCSALKTRLEKKKYQVEIISLSDFLRSKGDTTRSKQSQGTALRRELKCQPALALCAAASIRQQCKPSEQRSKRAFIIRSLKRPEEVEALRIIYGEAFLSIGVHTPKSKRIFYLKDEKGDDKPETTIECDENATDFYGQRIRDTFEFCDVFIKGIDPEFVGLERALKLLFGSVFTTPTIDEYAMAMAYAASLRSADLSRQVGAAIVNSSREIVAVGPNEVPRYGGGQPWENDSPDLRDYSDLGHDPNVVERDELINAFLESISTTFKPAGQPELNLKDDPQVRKMLKASGLLDITEFGRTVHAEMACLMSCLRNHVDVVQGTLYSSTFPCHNCVRHILASGIVRIKYIEPYPKSRAQKLFKNSCSFWDNDYDEKTGKLLQIQNALRLEPFIGIGPRKYHDLFSMKTLSGKRIERKNQITGKALNESTYQLSDLKWPSSQFGILEREERAVEQLKSLWNITLERDFPNVKDLIPHDLEESFSWKKYVDEDVEYSPTNAKPKQAEVAKVVKPKSAGLKRVKPVAKDRPMMSVEDGGSQKSDRAAG